MKFTNRLEHHVKLDLWWCPNLENSRSEEVGASAPEASGLESPSKTDQYVGAEAPTS
jgi:hypothetical protein